MSEKGFSSHEEGEFEFPDTAGYPDGEGTLDQGTESEQGAEPSPSIVGAEQTRAEQTRDDDDAST